MIKKNGFISISIIYSFFVVFLLLMLLIMSTYINNRFSFTIYKNDIKKKNTETYDPYGSSPKLANYISTIVSSSSSWLVTSEYGIRFQGNTPNNYVRFNGERWRIIGVFDSGTHGVSGASLVKIVKDTPLSISSTNTNEMTIAYHSGYNTWSNSPLRTYLNGTYLTSRVNSESKNLIQNVTWKTGTYATYLNDRLTSQYNYERYGTGTSGSVGLIYPSDYGYASLASYCPRTTYYLKNFELCRSYNWLDISSEEWTITPSPSSGQAYYIHPDGYIAEKAVTNYYAIRPVVYLKANVVLSGGSGTYDDPYTIAI